VGTKPGENTSIPSSKIEAISTSAKGKNTLLDPIFKRRLKQLSEAIKISEASIIKLMTHESGLDSTIKNSIGCVGLIQLCPLNGVQTRTVNGRTYTLEELRYNLEAQFDVIEDFWIKGYKAGKITKPADLYIYNFFPVAAGKPDSFIIQAQGLSATTVANVNPGFNRTLGKPKGTALTVGDLIKYYTLTNMI
jgi:hypothetical protein